MKPDKTRICMIGLGYIGLPTAALLASRGFHVTGCDVNEHVVDTVNRGKIHIVEPDLEGLVMKVVKDGHLKAQPEPVEADIFMITVPTPLDEQQKPGMQYVENATKAIAPYLRPGNLVIIESTSPVGTTEKATAQLTKLRPDLRFPTPDPIVGKEVEGAPDIAIAYCPERVLPGQIIHELIFNDRMVGGLTPSCTEKAMELYGCFVKGELKPTTAACAEMVKLTENAFRDTNIAFANELSMICDQLGLDVWEVIALANCHPRVNILNPGPGVGGHCIAVDPWFIVDSAPEASRMIRLAREINDGKRDYVVRRVQDAAKHVKAPTIACLGLSFKPDVDDLRESPALYVTEQIANTQKGPLLVVEPNIDSLPESLSKYKHVRMTDALSAIEEADIIVVLVNHRRFRVLDFARLENKVIINTVGAGQ